MAVFTKKARSYKRFVDLLRLGLPRALATTRDMSLYLRYFEGEKVKALRAVYSGMPEVDVKPLPGLEYGYYPGHGRRVFIHEGLAEQYETLFSLSKSDASRQAKLRAIGLEVEKRLLTAVLHEMIHWADRNGPDPNLRDRRDQYPDWAHRWELDRYGKIISNVGIPYFYGRFRKGNLVYDWDPAKGVTTL